MTKFIQPIILTTILISGSLAGNEDEPAAQKQKMVQVHTLDQSFGQVRMQQALLRKSLSKLHTQAESENDLAKKKELEEKINEVIMQLNVIQVALDTIFSVEQKSYHYNAIDKTVFIKVGSLEDAFLKSVQRRNTLKEQCRSIQDRVSREKDPKKKRSLENVYNQQFAQYKNLLLAAQVVWETHPQRDYNYDADSDMLYLKVTEEEFEKLKKEREEKKAAAAEKQK